jgi:hypothetical protein
MLGGDVDVSVNEGIEAEVPPIMLAFTYHDADV